MAVKEELTLYFFIPFVHLENNSYIWASEQNRSGKLDTLYIMYIEKHEESTYNIHPPFGG